MESSTSSSNDHKLETTWAFWYDKKMSKKTTAAEYRKRLHKLGTFDTIESFWKMYLHMKRPSTLEMNVNLYLFRDGPTTVPMWEAFPRGGCWILKVKKIGNVSSQVLGNMWHNIVMSTVGEVFEEPTVVGISVFIRRIEDLILVWNSDSRNDELRLRIGERFKQILELDPTTSIEYKYHASSMEDNSTFRNAKPYVFGAERFHGHDIDHVGISSKPSVGAESAEPLLSFVTDNVN